MAKKYAKIKDGVTIVLGEYVQIQYEEDGVTKRKIVDSSSNEAKEYRDSNGFTMMEVYDETSLPDTDEIDSMTMSEKTVLLKSIVKKMKGE